MRAAIISLLFCSSLVAAQGILQGALETIDCESDSDNPDECSGSTVPHGEGNDLSDIIKNVTGLGAGFSATANTNFGCVPALANPPSSFCAKIIDSDVKVDQATALSALDQIQSSCGANGATARCGHVFINGKDKSGGVLQVQFSMN